MEASPDTGDSALTADQIDVLITIERIGAGCSMFAISLTLLSFISLKKMRTTPNLFLFFASTADAGASIASMMGYAGLQRGVNSSLCQTQAFLFQWFMQSDPWWSCAMAVNVFLVFFVNVNPAIFKKYVWAYCIICFGGPMSTAIALISIEGGGRGPVFGDATLWCWIGPNWSIIRLYSYYIPIWICIFLSILIYIAVGYHVFHRRNQLRNVAYGSQQGGKTSSVSAPGSEAGDSAEESLTRRPDFYGTAVTEVQITSDFQKREGDELLTLPPVIRPQPTVHYDPTWTSRDAESQDESSSGINRQRFETVCTSDNRPHVRRTAFRRIRAVKSNASLKLKRLDPVKMAYLRTSFIFGFAVLITWIPSSVNRLYSQANEGRTSYPLSVASGCVLPLQGVWNATIYFTTSWSIFREEIKALRVKLFHKSNDQHRSTLRLDSRLDFFGSQHRDTLEQRRIPSVKIPTSNHCDLYELELEERYPGKRPDYRGRGSIND